MNEIKNYEIEIEVEENEIEWIWQSTTVDKLLKQKGSRERLEFKRKLKNV
jgi:hypothetical protein